MKNALLKLLPSEKFCMYAASFMMLINLGLVATEAHAAVTLSIESLVSVVVYLLILGAVVWLLLFIVGKVAPPEPFAKIITVIIYVVAALLLINLLLGFLGTPIFTLR